MRLKIGYLESRIQGDSGTNSLFRANVTTIPALNREFVPKYFCHPI